MTGEERLSWWQAARFGMFVHWGLYTVDGLDCWKMHDMGIPAGDYERRFEPRFDPRGFDAREICKVAQSAGCRYIVMGSRHHEGYCLWNTKTTRFSSVALTPRRDFIKEYVETARSMGLKVGFYYSLLDWRFNAYWEGPRRNPGGWETLVRYVHAQIEELLTLYGTIDILWWDGGWQARGIPGWGFEPTDADLAKAWGSRELDTIVRGLQPDIITNNRLYVEGDFATPETTLVPDKRPWEFCDTMGRLWGAAPQDLNRKTPREILTRLITSVSMGGNMLLNIGPDAQGRVQPWQREIMETIGRWMAVHGEAIYGCTGEWQQPFDNGLSPWTTTRKGQHLYFHLLLDPGEAFSIGNLHDYWFEDAILLDSGKKLTITHEPTRDTISGLPQRSPDEIAPVVRVRIRTKSDKERAARRMIGVDSPE